ncbi:MAG: zinc metallopeptidase [Aerococcus sp.]|nr:zinc metallopeptidase [Aerococcus sp.]
MFYPYYFFDPTMIFILLGILISGIASWNVNRTFREYDQYTNNAGYNGTEAAEKLLRAAGINDVRVSQVGGSLSDYYDPRNKQLKLSQATAHATSIAAVGVAAHECGHAMQDAEGYFFLRFRNSLVPLVNFGTQSSWIILMLGVMLGWNQTLINIGIVLFSLGFVFQVLTLPVEINASRRAMRVLESQGILVADELPYARKVLRAAAMTYVAAVFASLLSLFRVFLLFGDSNDRR